MINVNWKLLALGFVSLGIAGCGNQSQTPSKVQPNFNSPYVSKAEPAGAVGVGQAKEASKDEEDVVLVGRIGGSGKPFIDGVAAFTIVDPKVPYCSKEEGCPTPWDYCCEQNQVKHNIATIKITKDDKTVTEDARQLLGVQELTMVVVHGKAKRDADGNLTVLADQVYVKE